MPPTTTTNSNERRTAWEIAELFPEQGCLSDEDYLFATRYTRRLVEFTDGYIEVLPMPKTTHQLIVQYISNLLLFYAEARDLGKVLFAPLRMRLRPGKFREPDVIFMLKQNADRISDEFWERADLVMEVVSPEKPERDYVTKRLDYAEAGIP